MIHEGPKIDDPLVRFEHGHGEITVWETALLSDIARFQVRCETCKVHIGSVRVPLYTARAAAASGMFSSLLMPLATDVADEHVQHGRVVDLMAWGG